MGYIFRYHICRSCGKRLRVRQRRKPKTCQCGCKDFIVRLNWFIRFMAFGRKIEQKVGSEEIALKALRVREAEVARGKYRLRNEKKILVREFALGDYWNLYAKNLKSSRDYWNWINQHILPEWGDLYLHNVDRRDILAWVEKMRLKGNKPATLRNNLNVVKGFFSQAIKLELIEENPEKGIDVPKVDNKRRDFLSTEDYHRLLDAAGNDMLRMAIIIAAGTGMRRGELFTMEWSWCDFKKREITVPAEVAKSSRSRVIPMIEPIYRALKNMPVRSLKSPHVLTSPKRGKPYAEYMVDSLK